MTDDEKKIINDSQFIITYPKFQSDGTTIWYRTANVNGKPKVTEQSLDKVTWIPFVPE
jgi:hypothetical protein